MKVKDIFNNEKPLKMVCAWCKKIQTKAGTWIDDVENSNPKPENERVSHGICPECNKKHWGGK